MAFVSDISQWDLSKVTTMSAMFFKVLAFNGDIISEWDVSSVLGWTVFDEATTF
jgi:surface protein